jgi:release factor glutamine methyltransferase
MSGAVFMASNEAAFLDLARAVRDTGYHFVTVTPATHERVNRRPGNEWARSLTDVFGWSRPFRVDVLPPPLFELGQRAGVVVPHEGGWRSLVRLSSLDDELFVHSAYPTTDVHSVFFGPDTGRLVDAVIAHLKSRDGPIRRAVDIGCGTGAGAVAIAKRAREAEVVGVDINGAALRATELNASLAGVANVVARSSDMLRHLEGTFDLIVSNPPFMIDAAERAYRHGGGPLGAGLPLACVDAAIERLTPNGTLVLFTGAIVIDGETPFRAEATRRLDGAGLAWSYREVDPDAYGEELEQPAYARADRIALIVLTATRSD